MGAEEVSLAVADAGPVIHLNEIGCLSLLRIFETLHIPDAVWSETVGRGHVLQADVQELSADAEHHISDLSDISSLFVTRALVELAIAQLHKYSGQG